MTIYAFLYCDSTPESAAETISLHLTLKGTYDAMRAHRVATCVRHREVQIRYGKWAFKYDSYKWWGIVAMEVLE